MGRREESRFIGELSPDALAGVFGESADFRRRTVCLGGDPGRPVTACWLDGMVRLERAADYVLRPLARDERLRRGTNEDACRRLYEGAGYDLSVQERTALRAVAGDVTLGSIALFFPGVARVLTFPVGTEEKRGVTAPDNEPAVKGAQDGFVENLRTNTSLVRRHLRTDRVRIAEVTVGRTSRTSVDVVWVEGAAGDADVREVLRRVRGAGEEDVLFPGDLERRLFRPSRTLFPLALRTERPDRFCAGLAGGRVGLLAEGLPMGYLVPASARDFLRTAEDRADHPALAAVLTILRFACLLLTLLLPAFYVAVVTFHQEMIPTRLLLSILAARRDVPFRTAAEAMLLLVAFEILQEAGLRLPRTVGHTVSIIGGLVVGTAAVEAKIISPAVLIAVSAAGIAGYTIPSQEVSGAVRVWRFLLLLAAAWGGLFGMVLAAAVLLLRLARLESFSHPYLEPFAGAEKGEGPASALLHPARGGRPQ